MTWTLGSGGKRRVVEGSLRGIGLARPSLSTVLAVIWETFVGRMKILARYRGSFLLEALLPVTFAAMPILMGTAVAGDQAAENFNKNVGTTGPDGYLLYMLIGADLFMVVTIMLWVVAFWIRREMESGTLEALYLAPAKRLHIVTGVTAYAFARSMVAFTIALVAGGLILQINVFRGDVALMAIFLLLGLLPLWGLSFIFGAIIMKLKEANSVVNLLQWVLSFFMGVFFPIAALPPALQALAYAFPPTWLTQDIRATLLGLDYFLKAWYLDLAVMWVFALAVPLIGYAVFSATEGRLRRREGVGQF